MKQTIYSTKGMTLLEIMLVLAIAATIVAIGFQLIFRYRMEYNYNQVQSNVDTLFQGLRRFYYLNCQDGLLSPVPKETNPPITPPSLEEPFSIKIQDHLLDKKYLPNSWPLVSTMVDTGYGYQGYSAKFIPKQIEDRRATACFNFSDNVDCYRSDMPNNIILNWQMQVVVKMINANYAQAFSAFAAANCVITNAPSDTIAVNCAAENNAEGEYVVFQAAPTKISSDLWLTMPVVNEFNLLYTHDPMYELYNPNIKDGTTDLDKKYRYYLCGG